MSDEYDMVEIDSYDSRDGLKSIDSINDEIKRRRNKINRLKTEIKTIEKVRNKLTKLVCESKISQRDYDLLILALGDRDRMNLVERCHHKTMIDDRNKLRKNIKNNA